MADVAVFGWQDYLVFAVMLLLSAGIGIYYAIKDRNSKEGVKGYLLASRQMSFIPVSVSISLSFISAVTILGIPSEIYYFGSMYIWFVGAIVWVGPVTTEFFIPAFYRLEITSAFEYLELRFNRPVRLISTFIFIIQNIMYIGIMIYAPALALSSVTNFNLWAAVATIGIVCTFYTTLGGLKAVIWTDVFQGAVLLIGMIVTLAVSVNNVGGIEKVWEACNRGGRLEFDNFSFDPRTRTSVWSMVVGLGFLWLSVFGTSQSQVQRYLCCKTETEAKKGLLAGFVSAVLCLVISLLTGFTAYAYFETCDPFQSKRIEGRDQILPLMILEIFNNQPGLPGLFVAGLFAGCLSTVSSGINALACVAVKDFVQPFVKWPQRVLTIASKVLVFVFGALCIGMAILASVLGGVLQASLTALGLVGGPLLGAFSLGMIFPCTTSWGAGIGLALGVSLPTWIYIGSTFYPPPLEFLGFKSVNVSGCNITLPMQNMTTVERPGIADLYAVSYAYYAAIGFGTTIISGLLISFLSGGYSTRKEVDPRLIMPIFDHKIFCCLPRSFRQWMWCGLQRDRSKTKRTQSVAVSCVSYKERDENSIEDDISVFHEYSKPRENPPPYSQSETDVSVKQYYNEAFDMDGVTAM